MSTLSQLAAFGLFDARVPRYTSYPTAPQFAGGVGPQTFAKWIEAIPPHSSISLYVHVPFCRRLCWFCACRTQGTTSDDPVIAYANMLQAEIALLAQHLPKGVTLSRLHWGGGTPTMLGPGLIRDLAGAILNVAPLAKGAEFSVEIDPNEIDEPRLDALTAAGMNRASIGVQDFDPEVQKAVHRIQPASQVFALVASARKIGFESINIDLIYGLPRQTPESFDRTLAQVNELRPDRIALYAYAHLPERFKPQRRILAAELPAAASKIDMLSRSMDALMNAGYVYVGMDHFALPEDALAVAKRQGRLHRNFQGYSTQPDCDLLGLGVSAIGRMGGTYSQNAKTMAEYVDMLEQGQLPVVKGLVLSRDDMIRRAWIMTIMCQGQIDFASFNEAWLIDAKKYFTSELSQLESLQTQGLVELTDGGLQVTPTGWFFVRGVAMVFDKYLQTDRNRTRFSKII